VIRPDCLLGPRPSESTALRRASRMDGFSIGTAVLVNSKDFL
jgi:hypothetical protein